MKIKITKQNAGMLLIALAMGILQGCSSAALNKQLDEKIAQEDAVSERGDLQKETDKIVEKSPGLSSEQRSKLASLRDSTRVQLDKFRKESLKLRAVLIKDVASPAYNADEVDLIKTRMRNVEDQRLSTIFDAVDKANTILGRVAAENQILIHEFFQDPRGGHFDN